MPSKKLKVIKRIDWDKLQIHNEINIIADMVKSDIEAGVNTGIDINNSPFQELSPNTIAAKGHRKPLIDTGLMKKVYVSPLATKNNLVANVIPPKSKNRTNIGMYHNEGTQPYQIKPKSKGVLSFMTANGRVNTKLVNHPGLPKREWFGISERVLKKIRKMLSIRLMEKLRQRPVTITK